MPIAAVTPCVGGLSNHNYRVAFRDASLALLRVYRWTHDEPEPQRRIKEPWLHDLLARAGVPVPRVLASSNRCALLEWIEGVKLRQIALTEAPAALEGAWAEAGTALRLAHAANPFGGVAGEIVGNELRPFDRSWSEWNSREITSHTARLRELNAIDVDAATRIELICDRLPELLGEPAPVLAHNDAHPANVLVALRDGAWHLAAWIDWEYAWVADPDWDLARFAFFGTAQVGGPRLADEVPGNCAFPAERAHECGLAIRKTPGSCTTAAYDERRNMPAALNAVTKFADATVAITATSQYAGRSPRPSNSGPAAT